ncbi:nicotinamide N-methyltransferase-like, partial [Pelobates cultripes]
CDQGYQGIELVEAEEEKVRRIVKRCLKWDPTNDNPLGSIVLPQADCAISINYFDVACKDHESYRNSFRKFSSLLKVGGHLILFGLFNATYYMIGDHRFSFLNYNEDFLVRSFSATNKSIVRSFSATNKKQSNAESSLAGERTPVFVFSATNKSIVKGETLIDLTGGAAFCQLMVMSDFFKEVTILDSSDLTLKEMEKWLNKEPGAVDWSHAAEISCELKGVSELVEAEEEKVRRIVKRCLKWDPTNDNPLGSIVLPQADCAISVTYFDIACKDHESYRNSFRKFSSLLKVGGHLILFGLFNATYYMIGDHRFSFLNYNEDFVKEVLQDNGYITVIFEVYESKLNTHLIDHDRIGYIVARKERENYPT